VTYNPGQFQEIVPYVREIPDCVVIAGTADGDEGPCAKALWPDTNLVGVEPIAEQIAWQRENGWPPDAPLLQYALSNANKRVSIRVPEDRKGSSLCDDRPGEPRPVFSITLDRLLSELDFPPLKNIVLWMDIEGWEYQALLGARQTFASGCVQLVNVEELARLPEQGLLVHQFLEEYNFELVHIWNEQPGLCCDKVYRRKT